MAWMLQPHNYAQVRRPNLYNVDYRRVGAYKGMGGMGMGQAMGPLYTCPDGTQVLYTSSCPGGTPASAASGSAYDQLQAEIDALFGYTGAGQQPVAGAAPTTNYLPWIIGGVFLVMIMSMGGRR